MAIDLELQRELVRALRALPGIEDPSARTALLVGIDPSVTRSFTDLHTDLVGIVRDLDRLGARLLLTLVDNAIERMAPGDGVLRALRGRVMAAPGTASPDTAEARVWDGDAERRLRGALAAVYPTAAEARVVCRDIGLGADRVALEGAPVTLWFGVVTEARHQGKLDALLARALEDAPADETLRGLAG